MSEPPSQTPREAAKPGSAELRVSCTACQGAVVVKYELTREDPGDGRGQKWSCPHCGADHQLIVPGRILRVTAPAPEAPG